MKKWSLIILLLVIGLVFSAEPAAAQCSICTKSAQQLGEKPAKALNAGIIYLAFMPMAIVAYIGYRWYKSIRA